MPLTLSLFGDTPASIPLIGVSIDTRTLKPGELFAAVRGDRFDGHDFMAQAAAAGCAAILAEEGAEDLPPSLPVVIVPDVLHALGKAAQAWRDHVNPRVIAVTGSCGKTTVKEMLTLCLRQRFTEVHATQGNFNNHIGLPLTLLAMPETCQALVVEMGMSAAGEIAYLAQLARPDMGIITNVLPAHLEALGSLAAIADAKGELLEALPEDGVAIIPFGQPHTEPLRKKALKKNGRVKVLTVGMHPEADIHDPQGAGAGRMSDNVTLHWRTTGEETTVRLACQGEHIRQNVLTVGAAARAAGASPEQIARGLAGFNLPSGRGGLRLSPHGWRVVDDTYNANPGSVRAALHALPQPTGSGRRIAILGDMLELGKEAEFLHASLSREIAESGVTQLYTAGPLMACLHHAVVTAHGMASATPRIEAWHRAEPGQWIGKIAPHLRPGDVVLVKGSRGMNMERIVEHLVANAL